jgi:putative transposase
MDKSGANKVATDEISTGREVPIMARQVKYLNNIVEQDHRVIKRLTRPGLNFKSFRSVRNVLGGIELMLMIRKDQMINTEENQLSFAEQFYALAE